MKNTLKKKKREEKKELNFDMCTHAYIRITIILLR